MDGGRGEYGNLTYWTARYQLDIIVGIAKCSKKAWRNSGIHTIRLSVLNHVITTYFVFYLP